MLSDTNLTEHQNVPWHEDPERRSSGGPPAAAIYSGLEPKQQPGQPL